MSTFENKYIAYVTSMSEEWEPPIYPELDDGAWKEAWLRSNEHTKLNLAKAWSWLFTQKVLDVKTQLATAQRIWHTQRNWLKDLHPYIKDAFFKPIDLDLVVKAPYSPDSTATVLRKLWPHVSIMWFENNPSIRLSALDSYNNISNKNNLAIDIMGPLLHEILWEVASLPEAGSQHRIIAALLSTHGGAGKKPDFLEYSGARLWQGLGWACRPRNAGSTSKKEIEFLRQLLAEEPVEVSMVIFPRLWGRCLADGRAPKSDKGPVLPHGDVLTYGCTGEANPYAVLRSWFPRETLTWNLAEEFQMSLKDACAAVASKYSSNVKPDVEIPTNLSISIDE